MGIFTEIDHFSTRLCPEIKNSSIDFGVRNSYLNKTDVKGFRVAVYICDPEHQNDCEDMEMTKYLMRSISWTMFLTDRKVDFSLADQDQDTQVINQYVNRFVLDPYIKLS